VLPKEAIDKNYPDAISYVNAGFGIEGYENVNERRILKGAWTSNDIRPKAYDAWPVGDAIRDILVKGGVDPVKLFRQRSTNLSDDGITISENKISTSLDKINLSRNARYGNPIVPGLIAEDDDEYIWTTNFGDKQDDILKRVIDSYGYILSTDNEGYIEVKRVDSEEAIINFTEGSAINDGRAIGGTYNQTSAASVTTTVTGSKITVNTMIDTGTGLFTSGFRITQDASPSNKIPSRQNTFPFNILYGAFWGTTTGANSWNEVTYTKTRFGMAPPSGMAVSGTRFSVFRDTTRGAYPLSGGAREDYCPNIECDVYFGPGLVVGSGLASHSGNASYLVKTGFRVADLGPVDFDQKNQFVEIDFSKVINTTGGLYTLELVCTGSSESMPSGIGNGRFVLLNSYEFQGTSDTNPYVTIECSGISNEFFSGYSDIQALSSGSRVYNDIMVRERYPGVSLGNTGTQYTKVDVYDTGGTLVTSKSVLQYSSGTRFTQDGPNSFNDYSNVIDIHPWDLVATSTSGGVLDSYGEYDVKVYSTNPGGAVNVESVTVETESLPTQAWIFDTKRNITDGTFNINSNYDDVRNDVLVVGNQISTQVDVLTGQVNNPNNPIGIYTFSRMIDYGSIYNLGTDNNVGRKRDFVIFEPGIKSQFHSNWLASGTIEKYRKHKKATTLGSTAIPFLEPLDLVRVIDDGLGLINNDNTMQYIDTVNEVLEYGNYKMNITTTPFKPWPSFTRNLLPTINGDDSVFRNIIITDVNGIEVQSGGPATTGSYNPYTSESIGEGQNLVQIGYSQWSDGFTTIKVMDDNNRVVSYLVGGEEDGKVTGEWRDGGLSYQLLWGGIDEFGFSKITPVAENNENISGFIANPVSPGYYAFPNRYHLLFEVVDPFTEQTYRVDTKKLDTNYNPEFAAMFPGETEHGIDIVWSPMGDAKIVVENSMTVGGVEQSRLLPEAQDAYTQSTVRGQNNFGITSMPVGETVTMNYIPDIKTMQFSDQENNGSGIKIQVEFDDSVENWQRAYNYNVKANHIIHFGIMVESPDYIKTYDQVGVMSPVFNGTRAKDNLDADIVRYGTRYYDGKNIYGPYWHPGYNLILGNSVPMQPSKLFEDTYASGNALTAWKTFREMDLDGIVKVMTHNSQKIETYTTNEGLPTQISNHLPLDSRIYEFRRKEHDERYENAKDHEWANKFMFNRTPVKVYDEIDVISEAKFRPTTNTIEFTYNPTEQKFGGVGFDEIPELASIEEQETFKQTLREALNIAKWHYAFDKYGPTLYSKIGDSYEDISVRGIRKLFGNEDPPDGYSTSEVYWRENQDVANYVKLMVFHTVEFEIELMDNSGRGLTGNNQPARIYPRPDAKDYTNDKIGNTNYNVTVDNGARNENNRHDWQVLDTDGYYTGGVFIPGTNAKSMLYGYDKYLNRNKLVCHAYWTNPSNSAIKGTNSNPQRFDFKGLPSRLNTLDKANLWGDPYYNIFLRVRRDENGRPLVDDGYEAGIVFYHEGIGYGASNRYGAMWKDGVWYGDHYFHADNTGPINKHQFLDSGPEILNAAVIEYGQYQSPQTLVVTPEILESKFLNTNSYKMTLNVIDNPDVGTSTQNDAIIVDADTHFRRTAGPLWHELSLPAGFTLGSLDVGMGGIPNRGVVQG